MADERRQHERIDIRMKTRLWLDEGERRFEGFATTRNLAIGGTFIESEYLLTEGFVINMEMEIEDGDLLLARGVVVHRARERGGTSGMGIAFNEVDAENRERLLRFFVSDRIKEFYYERFVVEFPHLEQTLTLKDVALTINLWEDKEGRLTALRGPSAEKRNRTSGTLTGRGRVSTMGLSKPARTSTRSKSVPAKTSRASRTRRR